MNKKTKRMLLALLYLFLLTSQVIALFNYAKNGVNEAADILGLGAAITIIIYAGMQGIDIITAEHSARKGLDKQDHADPHVQ